MADERNVTTVVLNDGEFPIPSDTPPWVEGVVDALTEAGYCGAVAGVVEDNPGQPRWVMFIRLGDQPPVMVSLESSPLTEDLGGLN